MKYDITIKELFAGSERPLVEYFTGMRLRKVKPLDVEFQRLEARVSDLVVEGYTDSGRVVIHMEFQSANDPRIHWRMLRYTADICEAYGLPLYQLLLYVGSEPSRMRSEISYDSGEFGRLDYRYKLVDLGLLSRESLLSSGIPELYALLPLAEREIRREKPEEFLSECVKKVVESGIDLEEKKKTLLRAEIFAGLAFEKETIERIFREAEDMLDLTKSAGYQRIMEEGAERIVIRLLQRKFKDLPAHYMERIKAQDVSTLEKIAENIFEIQRPEDLERYLN